MRGDASWPPAAGPAPSLVSHTMRQRPSRRSLADAREDSSTPMTDAGLMGGGGEVCQGGRRERRGRRGMAPGEEGVSPQRRDLWLLQAHTQKKIGRSVA